MLIMAALGGAGLLFGPLVGAAILVPLEEISNNLLGGKGAGLTFVVYGAIIVIIARFQPGGILALINRLLDQAQACRGSERSRQCSLKPATSPKPSAASRRSMPPA